MENILCAVKVFAFSVLLFYYYFVVAFFIINFVPENGKPPRTNERHLSN